VTAIATERIPRPIAVDGVVTNDVLARTLVVRRPESLSGYQLLLWREAHGALARAEEIGWANHHIVWASGAGQFDVAHALPGDNLTFLFHFPVGNDAYRALVSKPFLAAIVTIDADTHRFMAVRFVHRSGTFSLPG
jgi:hypothetical protein